MRVKRIHVNRQRIAQNRKQGLDQPVLTVKVGRENLYGHDVEILGPSRLVDADACGMRPLSCGARVYIETKAPVLVDGVRCE